MDELFPEEEHPDNGDLRDPGLYPSFKFYIANLMYGYLAMAPYRINSLVSAYSILSRDGVKDAITQAPFARTTFLDSGAISPLIANLRGKLPDGPAFVRSWCDNTPGIVSLAWDFHQAGAAPGVVAALDLPAYRSMLNHARLTVDQALDITIRNAVEMLDSSLPPEWLPVFTNQGVSLEEQLTCMAEYERVGVLDAVRLGRAWLAIGGMAFEKSDRRIHDIHEAVRSQLGEGHIHALGVHRLGSLIPMVVRGWVQSADSSSPVQKVKYNLGPYRVAGPRPTFFVEASHAAASLYAEARLAQALERAKTQDHHHYRQEALTW